MQDVPQYRQKLEREMIKIRKEARNKIMKQMRQKLYFQTQPIKKIAELWGLAPKQEGQYTIIQILKQRYQFIIEVSDLLRSAMEEQHDSQKLQVKIQSHVQFWSYLLQQIFTQALKMNELLVQFFMDFITNTAYKLLAKSRILQIKVLNTLQIGMLGVKQMKQSDKIKNMVLKWVTGSEGLVLICNSVSQFLSPNQYINVYEVIKQSLKLLSYEKCKQCCLAIKLIMNRADFDDTYLIYTQQPQLMTNLLSQLVRHIEEENISQQADAIIYLIDSYDSLILDYARAGVGLFAVRMIICRRDYNILKGLQIIKYISQITQSKAIDFLLQDRQLSNAGLWKTFFTSQFVIYSTNISIRRQGFKILANIFSNGTRHHLNTLNNILKDLTQKFLLDLISQTLKIQQDPTIINTLLIMIDTLLYYSQNTQEQDLGNPILDQIINLGIDLRLKALLQYENQNLAIKVEKIVKNIQILAESYHKQRVHQ